MYVVHWLAQSSAEPANAWNIVQTGGVIGVLFLGLYLVLSGRVATKQQLSDLRVQLDWMREDRDHYRNIAERAVSTTEDHVRVSDEEIIARLEAHESEVTKRLSSMETTMKRRKPDEKA